MSVQAVQSSYVFDFGVNFAGRYSFTVIGCPAGRRLVFWPSENVTAAGLADQSTTGSPIFDGYTCSGRSQETTQPKFMYHGFRYLQVDNLAAAPELAAMTGQVIRQDNDAAGSLETSSALFNAIHAIIDRSIQSNSYSVLTDCPHREKLGWLEETHLVYDAVIRAYDIQAWSADLVRVIADAQTSSGLIPDIAPEFVVFSGGFRDEANWGSAGVRLPLKLYQSYGEMDVLTTYYPSMQRYIDYLTSQAGGTYLLDYGLGDWAAFDPCTPAGVTATFGYQQAVNAMITIATALGHAADAAAYSQAAGRHQGRLPRQVLRHRQQCVVQLRLAGQQRHRTRHGGRACSLPVGGHRHVGRLAAVERPSPHCGRDRAAVPVPQPAGRRPQRRAVRDDGVHHQPVVRLPGQPRGHQPVGVLGRGARLRLAQPLHARLRRHVAGGPERHPAGGRAQWPGRRSSSLPYWWAT